MSRLTAKDFHPEVLKLFHEYVHGGISRREFLDGAGKFAVGGMTATGILAALAPKFAEAQVVKPDDARIVGKFVEIPSPNGYGKVRGYLVQPAKVTGKLPLVLVVHENRGLNPHIEDMARRVALDNFIAFAPDALFPIGGYPGNEEAAVAKFRELDQAKTREDFVAAAEWLAKQPEGNGKLGVVGFCYGGAMSHFLATRIPTLNAAVPYYGAAPAVDQAVKVKAPILAHYADVKNDERTTSTWPPYEAALKAAGAKAEGFIYAGTQHGFNNDTTPRFDDAAAKLSWQRTIAFFNANLR
ncbi:MAG: dienelactone hydrolase family protein [Rhodocyclaceae bacterium]